MLKKRFFETALFLFFMAAAFCQNEKPCPLYYYGVATNVDDQNMLNMTQDLFAAQIRRMSDISLQDKRYDAVKGSYSQIALDTDGNAFFSLVEGKAPDECILFFVRIFRPKSDDKWECTFFAKNTKTKAIASNAKNYDSYYKILTDAKTVVQKVVAEARGIISMESVAPQAVTAADVPKALSAENVAGTWGGETDILKIILMRGGRGFIVFSNGATMNVSLSFLSEGDSKTLRIVQKDKFNASFYPDIDRRIILEYSDSAAPIEWNLAMTERGTLEGTKKTLRAKSGGSVEPASVNVVWTKK